MIYRDQLEAVYKLIEKPENWTQRYLARNSDGDGIDEDYGKGNYGSDAELLTEAEIATHPDATCWCLYGAAYKCGIFDGQPFAASLGFNFTSDVAYFNDRHSHAEVLDLLRAAIDRAPVRS